MEQGQTNKKLPNGPTLVVCVILTLSSFLLYGALPIVIPQFEMTFTSYGADLPRLTQFVLATYQGYFLFAVISAVATIILLAGGERTEKSERLLFRWVIFSFALSLTAFLVSMVAVYLPVFFLGSLV